MIKKTNRNDGELWFSGYGARSNHYNVKNYIRHSFFFMVSKLPIAVLSALIYDFFMRTSCETTHNDFCVFSHTVADSDVYGG